MQKINDYIDSVENLPATPAILPDLMKLVSEVDVDTDKIVKLIAIDPALTANVLRISNSAFYRGSEVISNAEEAILRLGLKQVYNIVIAAAAGATLSPAQGGYGIDSGELWKHSVTAAVAAQLIARETRRNEMEAFTAALMHDIGKIILSGALSKEYITLLDDTRNQQSSLLEGERKILGTDHAEVGACLLEQWKFPQRMVDSVKYHHHPGDAGDAKDTASILYLGNLTAYFMGNGFAGHAFALRGREEALEILELSHETLPHFMLQTYDNLQMIEALLQIAT